MRPFYKNHLYLVYKSTRASVATTSRVLKLLFKLASLACGDEKLAKRFFPHQKSQFYATFKSVGFLEDEKQLVLKAQELKLSPEEVRIEPLFLSYKDKKLVTKGGQVMKDLSSLIDLKTVDKPPKKERTETSQAKPFRLYLYGSMGNGRSQESVQGQILRSSILSCQIEFTTKAKATDIVIVGDSKNPLPESLKSLKGKTNLWHIGWLDYLLNFAAVPGWKKDREGGFDEIKANKFRYPGTKAPKLEQAKSCIVLESGKGNEIPSQISADPNGEIQVSFVSVRVAIYKQLLAIDSQIKGAKRSL